MRKVEKNIPLAQRAYDAIKQMIISGELGPHQPVPESVLAKELDISRSPVKAALTRLQEDGFVIAEAWKKPYVVPLDTKYIDNVYQIRQALEAQCALCAIDAIPLAEIDALNKRLDAIGDAATVGHASQVYDALLHMQRLIRQYCDNDLLNIMVGKMDDHLERVRRASRREDVDEFAPQDFQMLRIAVETLRRRDAQSLATAIRDNLEQFRAWIISRWRNEK